MDRDRKFLNAKQVSEYLCIPVRTVQYLSKQGKIRSYKIGKQWRYLREDIENFGPEYSAEAKSNFLTAKQLSKYLCMPVRTIRRLSKQGKIKAVKIGKHWRYNKSDIERYANSGTVFSKKPARSSGSIVERSDRRSCQRINSNFLCRYRINLIPYKNIIDNGIIKNISACGAFLDVQDKRINNIEIDDPVVLTFNINNKSKIINIETEGKIVRKNEKGLGVVFRNMDDETRNRMIKYVG